MKAGPTWRFRLSFSREILPWLESRRFFADELVVTGWKTEPSNDAMRCSVTSNFFTEPYLCFVARLLKLNSDSASFADGCSFDRPDGKLACGFRASRESRRALRYSSPYFYCSSGIRPLKASPSPLPLPPFFLDFIVYTSFLLSRLLPLRCIRSLPELARIGLLFLSTLKARDALMLVLRSSLGRQKDCRLPRRQG